VINLLDNESRLSPAQKDYVRAVPGKPQSTIKWIGHFVNATVQSALAVLLVWNALGHTPRPLFNVAFGWVCIFMAAGWFLLACNLLDVIYLIEIAVDDDLNKVQFGHPGWAKLTKEVRKRIPEFRLRKGWLFWRGWFLIRQVVTVIGLSMNGYFATCVVFIVTLMAEEASRLTLLHAVEAAIVQLVPDVAPELTNGQVGEEATHAR